MNAEEKKILRRLFQAELRLIVGVGEILLILDLIISKAIPYVKTSEECKYMAFEMLVEKDKNIETLNELTEKLETIITRPTLFSPKNDAYDKKVEAHEVLTVYEEGCVFYLDSSIETFAINADTLVVSSWDYAQPAIQAKFDELWAK